MIKFTWNIKDFKIAKTVLKRKKIGVLIIPDSKTYYKVTVTTALVLGWTTEYWSKRSLEISFCICPR